MVFNSSIFLVHFIITYFLFLGLKETKSRQILLLISSYIFYGYAEPILTLLLFAVTAICFIISNFLHTLKNEQIRNFVFTISLILVFLPLIYLKYSLFILEQLNLVHHSGVNNFILPVGISFYTFQSVGYLIDVFRRKYKPENSFLIFTLYVSFFPQLVAGPIERASHLIPELKKDFKYSSKLFFYGLNLICWGFFKKLVISDQLSQFVDPVYENSSLYDGTTLLIATVFFGFQIYCDFSGYTDIATGVAKIFGVNLMKNFDRPYFALSLTDFWRRWHISLSTWFKDYVYMPLGGSKVSFLRWSFNILIVFLISGIWHGANTTFVIWGLVHGIALIIVRAFSPIWQKGRNFIFGKNIWLENIAKFVLTFSFVNLTWVFFRSKDIEQALQILKEILNSFLELKFDLITSINLTDSFNTMIFSLIVLIILEGLQNSDSLVPELLLVKDSFIRISMQYILILFILFLGNFGESPFIYFRF